MSNWVHAVAALDGGLGGAAGAGGVLPLWQPRTYGANGRPQPSTLSTYPPFPSALTVGPWAKCGSTVLLYTHGPSGSVATACTISLFPCSIQHTGTGRAPKSSSSGQCQVSVVSTAMSTARRWGRGLTFQEFSPQWPAICEANMWKRPGSDGSAIRLPAQLLFPTVLSETEMF